MSTVKEMNEILEECILSINPTTLANITTSKLNAYYQDVQLDMRRVVLVQNLFNDIYNNWTEYQIRYQHHQKQLKQKNKRQSQSRSSRRRSQAAKAKRFNNSSANKENVKFNDNVPASNEKNNNAPINTNTNDKKNDNDIPLGILLKNKESNKEGHNDNREDSNRISQTPQTQQQQPQYLQQNNYNNNASSQSPSQQTQSQPSLQQTSTQYIQSSLQQQQQPSTTNPSQPSYGTQSSSILSTPSANINNTSSVQFQTPSTSAQSTSTTQSPSSSNSSLPQIMVQSSESNYSNPNGRYPTNHDIIYDSYVEELNTSASGSSDSESSDSASTDGHEELYKNTNFNQNAPFNSNVNGYLSSEYETEESEDDYASNYESDYEKGYGNININGYTIQEPYTTSFLSTTNPSTSSDDNNNNKGLRRQRSYSEGQLDLMSNKDFKDLTTNPAKNTRKTSVPTLTVNTSFNEGDSETAVNDNTNNSFVIRSFSIPPSSENDSTTLINNSSSQGKSQSQGQSQAQPTYSYQQANSLFIPPFELTENNTIISPIKFSWMSNDDDEEEGNNTKSSNDPFATLTVNQSRPMDNSNQDIPPPTRNISLNHSLPIIQNGNTTMNNTNNYNYINGNSNGNVNNNINTNVNQTTNYFNTTTSGPSTLDNYVVRYPYFDDDEEDNFFNKNNYLYKPQIHLEKQQIGQLEQLQSQIQPEYKEQIQQLQQQQEQLVINTNKDLLLTPPKSVKGSPKKSPKVPKIIIPKAQPETKLLNDYADVMDIVSLIPTILGENIDIPPDQSPIRQHFVAPSPTSKSVPITPLSEQINVTSKRHNDYIKKKEENSLKRRSSLKYESYHGYDDSTTDNSPAIVYSNPDTSCSFKRSGSNTSGDNNNNPNRLSINTGSDGYPRQNIHKAKSPLGLNAPMLPPMMMDSTTAAMLETHGNSLLLQQDSLSSNTSMSGNGNINVNGNMNGNGSLMPNMSFTEGVTNKFNNLNGSVNNTVPNPNSSMEIPNSQVATPIPRKAYHRRTVMPGGLEEKSERHHRSRRHSHSHHRSLRPDGTHESGDKERDRERREHRDRDRERRHSRRPDETESERRERHRRSRRPVTIIDENGVEKVMYKRRHHHHRSSRYVEGGEGNERPERPRSSSSSNHRHSHHRQSVAVGEQQLQQPHHHTHLRSKHQSIASNKASPSLDYSNTSTTSFSIDPNPPVHPTTTSATTVPLPNNPGNITTNNTTNINTNPTNLPTQEINDFFDNIFKLNWTL